MSQAGFFNSWANDQNVNFVSSPRLIVHIIAEQITCRSTAGRRCVLVVYLPHHQQFTTTVTRLALRKAMGSPRGRMNLFSRSVKVFAPRKNELKQLNVEIKLETELLNEMTDQVILVDELGEKVSHLQGLHAHYLVMEHQISQARDFVNELGTHEAVTHTHFSQVFAEYNLKYGLSPILWERIDIPNVLVIPKPKHRSISQLQLVSDVKAALQHANHHLTKKFVYMPYMSTTEAKARLTMLLTCIEDLKPRMHQLESGAAKLGQEVARWEHKVKLVQDFLRNCERDKYVKKLCDEYRALAVMKLTEFRINTGFSTRRLMDASSTYSRPTENSGTLPILGPPSYPYEAGNHALESEYGNYLRSVHSSTPFPAQMTLDSTSIVSGVSVETPPTTPSGIFESFCANDSVSRRSARTAPFLFEGGPVLIAPAGFVSSS